MNQTERVVELLQTLKTLGVESALVGGLAVSMRSRERFTRDIDFAVAIASDQQAEQLGLAMQRLGYRLIMVLEQEAKGVISTLRFQHPDDKDDQPSIDLLCGSTGIEAEIVAGSTIEAISAEHSVPVASTPHLIAMKVLSVNENRDQDRGDLRALFAVATKAEIELARESVKLVVERGFSREKDLLSEFERLLEELR